MNPNLIQYRHGAEEDARQFGSDRKNDEFITGIKMNSSTHFRLNHQSAIITIFHFSVIAWILFLLTACSSTSPLDSNSPQSTPTSSTDPVEFIWPAIGTTISRFDGRNNKGIDIAGKSGDPIMAAADGRVVYAGSGLKGYGNMIIIKHSDVFVTAYAHNRALLVRENNIVRAGQKIAEMGDTDADRVKLHFEIRQRGVAVDPEPYLIAGGTGVLPPSPRATAPLPQSDDAPSTGSGFAVTPTLVVTNAHVAQKCARVVVGGRGPARLRAIDGRNDLALLEVPAGAATATLSQGKLRQGDSVTVVGYPLPGLLASGPQVTAGNVTALAGLAGDTGLFQISAPVQPGSSGGPVLDASGNVVGVVVSKLNVLKAAAITGDFPQNVNFAVSLLSLRNFLDAHDVPYRSVLSTKKLATSDAADIAKPYTVYIECFH